jgi:hypothetical protein
MAKGFPRIIWGENTFQMAGLTFIQDWGAGAEDRKACFPQFVIMKSRDNVEEYVRVLSSAEVEFENVLELGVMRGGSCAFFNTLLRPRNHLAIDLVARQTGLDALVRNAAEQGRKLLTVFGVYQDDVERIIQLSEELTAAPSTFDLIIDDASHDYETTLRSFNGLFPRLRSGGIYVLEDWGWAHWGGIWQNPEDGSFPRPAMSNVVLHAALSCTSNSGTIISHIDVTPVSAYVYRGPAQLGPEFAVESSYLARGKSLALL